MTPNPTIFTPLLIAALTFFVWSSWRRLSLLGLGQPEDRFDNIGSRIKEMLLFAFIQKRVLARPFGLDHFVIFWSFLILLIANGEFLLNGVFPSISLTRLPEGIYFPLMLTLDIVSLLALAAVIITMIRRIVAPPYPEARTPYREWLNVGPALIEQIRETRARGGRVIAVGTTVVRALESASCTGELQPFAGETQIFIFPGYRIRSVDGLVTNFHLPESTLLMLVSAYAGRDRTLAAYQHAVEERYRFFSYGDAMLIWPPAEHDNAVHENAI